VSQLHFCVWQLHSACRNHSCACWNHSRECRYHIFACQNYTAIGNYTVRVEITLCMLKSQSWVSQLHFCEYKSHYACVNRIRACWNHTLRSEITLVRVNITLCVWISPPLTPMDPRLRWTLWGSFGDLESFSIGLILFSTA
jgi:hypothetical protein